MFVSDIKENYYLYNLPEEFADILPDTCSVCGAPLEISETLTGLHCSNPRCQDKIVKRIEAICQDLGVLDFGEARIEKFVEYYSVTNPLDIFELRVGMPLAEDISQEVSDKIISQIRSHREFLLWEFVMYANIPYVRTSARKIFQGYSNLEEAYADIEAGGVSFIQDCLDIKNEGELSIQAIKIYKSLMEFKDDLLEGEQNIIIKDLKGIKELNVVCSDQVGGGFSKKAEFYNFINTTFADKLHVNFLPSVNRKIDYLVWAGADGSPARYTSKVKAVEGYNQKGCNIPILTATQFIEEMKEL